MDFILPVNYTIAQLRAATKTQIINAISNYLTNNFTKRQIIIWLLNNTNILANATISIYEPDGQVRSQTDRNMDIETGLQVDGRVVTYAYYPTGEVDTITISTRDSANKEIAKKIIKHFIDGRQPEVV